MPPLVPGLGSPFEAQESESGMRRKRFQRGGLRARKHGRARVWVAHWWENGGRRSQAHWRRAEMSQIEEQIKLSRDPAANQRGHSADGRPGPDVWAVRRVGLLAPLPANLEGIDRVHISPHRQAPSCSNVRRAIVAEYVAPGDARLSCRAGLTGTSVRYETEGAFAAPPHIACLLVSVPLMIRGHLLRLCRAFILALLHFLV